MLNEVGTNSVNRRLFETSADLILVADAYGVLIHASPSALAIAGYRAEEIVGRLGSELIFADDLELTRREMRLARITGAPRQFNCRYLHRDGHTVPQAWVGIWSEPDHRYFFIGRALTERDQTEAQLRQAQKMEAVGRLTGGVR